MRNARCSCIRRNGRFDVAEIIMKMNNISIKQSINANMPFIKSTL
jgi:hypothetical protein